MQELASAIRAGDPVVGSWLTVGHPAVAEVIAAADFDFVVMDTEHSPASLESVADVLRGVEAAPGWFVHNHPARRERTNLAPPRVR